MPVLRATALALAICAFSAGSAHAQDIIDSVGLTHRDPVPFTIATPGSFLGTAVAVADVNGDGYADVIGGAWGASPQGRNGAGAVEVRFGPHLTGPPLIISGAHPGDRLGFSVASLGDINGDNRDDLLIGAYQASPDGRPYAGSAYVVYGRGPGRLDLATAGDADRLEIDGANPRDQLGRSVSPAGDQNGDGINDLLLGAPGSDQLERGRSGAAYVVDGSAHGGVVDLAQPGAARAIFAGPNPSAAAGWSVAGGKDVTGDGVPDIVIGGPEDGTHDEIKGIGGAYLVHGPIQPGGQDLAVPADNVLYLLGPAGSSLFGWSVTMPGDVTGDGLGDVLIGSWSLSPLKRALAGAAWVVSGTARTGYMSPATAGPGGFEIMGATAGDRAGRSVAGMGDLNGDGINDVAVGSTRLSDLDRTGAGGLDLLYGGERSAPVDLIEPDRVIHVTGAHSGDQAGESIASGDIDGDGRPDVVIGAPLAEEPDRGGVWVLSDPAPLPLRVRADAPPRCGAHRRTAPTVMIGLGGGAWITLRAKGAQARRLHLDAPDIYRVHVPVPSWARAGGAYTVKVIAKPPSERIATRNVRVRACTPAARR